MGFFNSNNKVVFLKETSNIDQQIAELRELKEKAPKEIIKKIDNDIRNLESGLIGEKNIIFELKNSGIPMYVLHDIYVKHEDLSAQSDFVVITSKINFIIECKNLYGNITINNRGEFIRTTSYNGKTIKEGIYSPITQNQRHMEILKQKKASKIDNIIKKHLYEKLYYTYTKSIVVLANPKTILNFRYAPKEIKKQVIRSDQLIKYIKTELSLSKDAKSSDKEMRAIAERILSYNTNNEINYCDKYKKEIDEYQMKKQENTNIKDKPKFQEQKEIKINKNTNNQELIKKLKVYRYNQAKNDHVKPYFIFTNKVLENLVKEKPKTLDDLHKIAGFGDVKVEKYGQEIIEIINQKS